MDTQVEATLKPWENMTQIRQISLEEKDVMSKRNTDMAIIKMWMLWLLHSLTII